MIPVAIDDVAKMGELIVENLYQKIDSVKVYIYSALQTRSMMTLWTKIGEEAFVDFESPGEFGLTGYILKKRSLGLKQCNFCFDSGMWQNF